MNRHPDNYVGTLNRRGGGVLDELRAQKLTTWEIQQQLVDDKWPGGGNEFGHNS